MTSSLSSLRLLAPAGGPEQLQMALHFGADEVFLAGKHWGMRARSKNFDREQLACAVKQAHAQHATVHLTLNTILRDSDIDEMPEYLDFINQIGIDAVIVADLGAMALVRRYAPNVEMHISTQTSVMNTLAAEEYMRLGARRLVLAREMTLDEIAQLKKRISPELELEVFAHGSMCMAMSGRCFLSSELVGRERGANAGACTQPCRWGWALVEESKPDMRRMSLEQDDRWSYILSSNDLCMLEHLDDIAAAGVTAIKLEGRAKGAYYTACVTNAYRHVLDGESAASWIGELDAVSHRPYSTGFFYGNPTQNPGNIDYVRDRLMVATVISCSDAPAEKPAALEDPTTAFAEKPNEPCSVTPGNQPLYEVLIHCRNKLELPAQIQILSPGQHVRECELDQVYEWNGYDAFTPQTCMSRAMGTYRIFLPYRVDEHDIICLKQ